MLCNNTAYHTVEKSMQRENTYITEVTIAQTTQAEIEPASLAAKSTSK
jgi:hypothetical protein